MTANAKANSVSFPLNAAFVNGIGVSISNSNLSVFDFLVI